MTQLHTVADGYSERFTAQIPMENFQRQITGEVVYSLETCSKALRRNGRREPVLTAEAVSELIDSVRDLMDDIMSSELPEELKLALVGRLRDVEAALLSVRISGYTGVERALDALSFTAFRSTVTDSRERSYVGGKIADLWRKLTIAVYRTDKLMGAAARTIDNIKEITGGG